MPPVPAATHRLTEIVSELLALVDGFVPASARGDLEAGFERLEHERGNLVVLGEFKRGKSTLVNALLDTDIVPTGVLPLTAVVTVVRGATRRDCSSNSWTARETRSRSRRSRTSRQRPGIPTTDALSSC